jgi:hypothetical protein
LTDLFPDFNDDIHNVMLWLIHREGNIKNIAFYFHDICFYLSHS